jgi:hypothetical protein
LASANPSKPNFSLRASPDTLNFGQRASEVVTVSVDRSGGFDGEVALEVEGLPSGVTASQAVLSAGMTSVPITLTAASDAPKGGFSYRIVGTARGGDRAIERTARPMDSPQLLLSLMAASPEFQVGGVGDAPPFTLDLEPQEITLKPGETAQVTVQVHRTASDEAAKGEAALELENVPQGVTLESPAIPADKSTGVLTLKAAQGTGNQTVPLIVRGRIKEMRIAAPALIVHLVGGKP